MKATVSMESDDYDSDLEIDIAFGQWLKERRTRSRYLLLDAALVSGIQKDRLEALEQGESNRGITHNEAEKLSLIYGLDLRAILHRAVTG